MIFIPGANWSNTATPGESVPSSPFRSQTALPADRDPREGGPVEIFDVEGSYVWSGGLTTMTIFRGDIYRFSKQIYRLVSSSLSSFS